MTTDVPMLHFVDSGAIPPTLNIVLYGPAGSGKTTGACSAPGPLLVLNAEGSGALRFSRRQYGADKIREVAFENTDTLYATLAYLRSAQAPDFATVVVDSIGAIYGRLLEQIGGTKPQIQHYGTVNTLIIRFVRQLRDLPVNVVLIAHEKIDDQEGDRIVRPLTGGQQLPEQIMQEMDVVAYLGIVDDGKNPVRYVAQLAQDRGRRAKDRTGLLGRSRDVDLTEWVAVANVPDQEELPWDGPAELPEIEAEAAA